MTAQDRLMNPERREPGAKLGLLAGGVAFAALVTLIVTAEPARSLADQSVRPSADRRDNYLKTASRQGSADVLADRDRKDIHSTLRQLQRRLATLRQDPTVKPDHWADAQVFVKSVVWALDLEPALDDKTLRLVRKALRRAQERIDALAAGRQPWTTKRGRLVRGFVSDVDGSVQPYGLVVPASYNSEKPIRLDVVLHGSTPAVCRGELLFTTAFDEGDTGGPPAPAVNYIEVHPLGRLGENAYRFEGEIDVEEAIASVCRNYNIDRKRIVLRGSSLGGVGTWQLGLKRPARYAALGPVAGPVDTIEFANSPWPHFVRLEPLTPWQKTLLHLVDAIDYTANAGMVPVVALMGDKDPYFSSHLLIEKAFKKEGIPFVGLVDRGAGHGVSAKAFREQMRLLEAPAARGIDPAPRHIRFVTWTLKFSRCHWIEILGLEKHYRRAEIDARIAEDGSISIAEPTNITRFAIRPPRLPKSSPKAIFTVGKSKIDLPKANGEVIVEQRDGKWVLQVDRKRTVTTGKRPGLQGPIDDAFATRFLCVRGTGRAWNPAVGAWADASLDRFASEWRRHYRGDLPIKKDVDVTQDDVRRSNLILFGDPGSNRWIRDILPRLPLRWTREEIQLGKERYGATDHGIQLIFPNPLAGAEGRYVVLNSGHTYHDPELRFSYMVFPRVGDWAIVKVGENPPRSQPPSVAETILLSGFFDEDWAIR
jgi:poly(3-hydroxybutyrate) depolymerase